MSWGSLPAELRAMILEMTWEPQHVTFPAPIQEQGASVSGELKAVKNVTAAFRSNYKYPVSLFINRESRYETFRRYTFRTSVTAGMPNLYLNPTIDIVDVSSILQWTSNNETSWAAKQIVPRAIDTLTGIRDLTIAYRPTGEADWLWQCLEALEAFAVEFAAGKRTEAEYDLGRHFLIEPPKTWRDTPIPQFLRYAISMFDGLEPGRQLLSSAGVLLTHNINRAQLQGLGERNQPLVDDIKRMWGPTSLGTHKYNYQTMFRIVPCPELPGKQAKDLDFYKYGYDPNATDKELDSAQKSLDQLQSQLVKEGKVFFGTPYGRFGKGDGRKQHWCILRVVPRWVGLIPRNTAFVHLAEQALEAMDHIRFIYHRELDQHALHAFDPENFPQTPKPIAPSFQSEAIRIFQQCLYTRGSIAPCHGICFHDYGVENAQVLGSEPTVVHDYEVFHSFLRLPRFILDN